MMGGADKIMARASSSTTRANTANAIEILNKLVYAEPDNQAAKDLLADVFEQIGYQKESPSVRNSFLGAAYELRSGIPGGPRPRTAGQTWFALCPPSSVARLPRHPPGQQERPKV